MLSTVCPAKAKAAVYHRGGLMARKGMAGKKLLEKVFDIEGPEPIK